MTNPAPVTPPPSGIPKWLIVLIVILLIFFLGCCGGLTACHFMCSAVREAAPAIGTSIQNRVAEQVKKEGFEAAPTGGSVSLPANFPEDLPAYSGFRATSKATPPGATGGTVNFEGTDPPKTVADFYESTLTKKGWTQNFSNVEGNVVTQSYTKDDATIAIIISGGNKTTLNITYSKK